MEIKNNRRKEDKLLHKLMLVAGVLGSLITIGTVVNWFASTTFISRAEALMCNERIEKRVVENEKKIAVIESKLDNIKTTSQRNEEIGVEILKEIRRRNR